MQFEGYSGAGIGYRSLVKLADCDIIALAQQGDKNACEFLLYKYRNLVQQIIKSYYLIGADKDDLNQIGMIGLWQAIIDFNSDQIISFQVFAKVCIRRHVITAIKTATRQKQMILNNSLSFFDINEGNIDLQTSGSLSVLSPQYGLDDDLMFNHAMDNISKFERAVLQLYKSGQTYREIALELNCSTKAVDNALVRIKRKVTSFGIVVGANPA